MTWPRQSEAAAFYGQPDSNNDFKADPKWEAESLVLIKCPWQLVASWDEKLKIKGIRIHKKCSKSLEIILERIWRNCGQDYGNIKKLRMHLFGGGYNFRLMRGVNRLSMHSYGCAVDFDPERNGLGTRWVPENGMMHPMIVEEFEREGWAFGGRWKRPDAMHFQAAKV